MRQLSTIHPPLVAIQLSRLIFLTAGSQNFAVLHGWPLLNGERLRLSAVAKTGVSCTFQCRRNEKRLTRSTMMRVSVAWAVTICPCCARIFTGISAPDLFEVTPHPIGLKNTLLGG